MSEEITRQLPDGILQTILDEVRAIKPGLDKMNARLDEMNARLNETNARLDETNARLSALEERVTKLEERVDRRLMETRPIWEAVLARLDKIEERLGSVETRLGEIEEGVKDARRSYMANIKQFVAAIEDLRDDVEKRLAKLESRNQPFERIK